MTTVTVSIPASLEVLDDGTTVAWPAATITAQPGYFIYVNIGSSITYTADLPYTGTSYDSLTFGDTLAGGTFPTGTFTDRNANTCYYTGPYCAFPAGVVGTPATDLTDDGFADTEEWGFVEFTKDPETGEYPVTTPSGQLRVLGQHQAPGSTGRRHLHPSNPGKYTWHGIVWTPNAVDNSNTYISWTGGSLRAEGSNAAIRSIAASALTSAGVTNPTGPITSGTPPWLHAFNNQHVIFNNTGATITSLLSGGGAISIPDQYLAAVDTYDHTDPAHTNVYWVGQLAPSPDPDSGAIWIHAPGHSGSHVQHGGHYAGKSINVTKLNSKSGGSPVTSGYVATADGSGAVTWQAQSAGTPTSISNAGTTLSITSNGHVKVISSNTAPSITDQTGGNLTTHTLTAGSDSAGIIHVQSVNNYALPPDTDLLAVTFGTSYSSAPRVVITGIGIPMPIHIGTMILSLGVTTGFIIRSGLNNGSAWFPGGVIDFSIHFDVEVVS